MCSRRTQIAPIPACVAIRLLAGCHVDNGADQVPVSQSPATNKVSSIGSEEASRGSENSVPKAYFAIAGTRFELDTVICFGSSTATITSSDSQKRADHPVVSIKIYDPAMSGGQSINTFSAHFDRGDHEEHWKLLEGTVEKQGKTVTASGTLTGTLLLPQPGGTRKSAALGPPDVLPFEARIECRR